MMNSDSRWNTYDGGSSDFETGESCDPHVGLLHRPALGAGWQQFMLVRWKEMVPKAQVTARRAVV